MAIKTINPDGSERILVSPVIKYAPILKESRHLDSGRCTNAKCPQCPLYNDISEKSVSNIVRNYTVY